MCMDVLDADRHRYMYSQRANEGSSEAADDNKTRTGE